MRNEQYWKEHIEVYNYIRDNYQSFRDIDLTTAISERFKIDIASENIRYLRRCEGWKKRVSPDSESVEKFEKVVFVGDFHIPFHDIKLLRLFMQFLHYFKPDKLFLMGDLLDCYSVSTFNKDPKRIAMLQDELDLAEGILNWIYREVTDVTFLEGNHEARVTRHLRKNPELFGLNCLRMPELLGLVDKKIKYYPYLHPPINYHKLQIHHGNIVRKYSGWSAKGLYEKYGGNGIVGHSHRMGNFIKRTTSGICGWWENGCLCSLKPEYLDFVDWVQGWSIAYFTKKDLFHIEQVPVIDYKFLFNGRLFKT